MSEKDNQEVLFYGQEKHQDETENMVRFCLDFLFHNEGKRGIPFFNSSSVFFLI